MSAGCVRESVYVRVCARERERERERERGGGKDKDRDESGLVSE